MGRYQSRAFENVYTSLSRDFCLFLYIHEYIFGFREGKETDDVRYHHSAGKVGERLNRFPAISSQRHWRLTDHFCRVSLLKMLEAIKYTY